MTMKYQKFDYAQQKHFPAECLAVKKIFTDMDNKLEVALIKTQTKKFVVIEKRTGHAMSESFTRMKEALADFEAKILGVIRKRRVDELLAKIATFESIN